MPSPDVLIVYRNLQAAVPGTSHVGLGVNSLHTVKVLRQAGVPCDVVGIRNRADLDREVSARPATTHVVIEAPFLAGPDLLSFCMANSRVQVCSRVHSQVAFLQVEAGAIVLMREYIRIQDHTPNFRLAANSPRLADFLGQVYATRPQLLPNLYYPSHGGRAAHRVPTGTVKVGSFGAIRLMKNHITAAASALMLASAHRLDLEFYLSVNREENGRGVLDAIRALFAGVADAKLVEVPWACWSDFRRTIATLDLHVQLSMSETFNITCADAISAGVPSVIGEAIDWMPSSWVAPIDDAEAAARVGWQLLNDPFAAEDGQKALAAFNADSLKTWMAWLSS